MIAVSIVCLKLESCVFYYLPARLVFCISFPSRFFIYYYFSFSFFHYLLVFKPSSKIVVAVWHHILCGEWGGMSKPRLILERWRVLLFITCLSVLPLTPSTET